MSIRVQCRTLFDITATGVKSHFSANRVPFVDDAGNNITTLPEWHRSRNQQRNWETINQLISLRTLPEDISMPSKIEKDGNLHWCFEFTVENPSTIELAEDPVGALIQDCRDVPMLVDLDESAELEPCLVPGSNIYFELQSDK